MRKNKNRAEALERYILDTCPQRDNLLIIRLSENEVILKVGDPANFTLRYNYITDAASGQEVWAVKLET